MAYLLGGLPSPVGNFSGPRETVRKLITAAREGTLDYRRRDPVKIDWGEYDRAQIHEMADTLALIRLLVDAAAAQLAARRRTRRRRRGPPPVPAAEVTKILLAQEYFGVPNRVAEGLVEMFGEKLGLPESFSYKSIERGYSRSDVRELLDEVFALTNAPVQGLEKIFSVDGSGAPTRVGRHYATSRAKQKEGDRGRGAWAGAEAPGRPPFVYTVSVVGVRYKLLSAHLASCDAGGRELAAFPTVLHQTKQLHPGLEMVLGDGLYAGRPMVRMVAEVGAVPRFLPRRNVTMKRMGVRAWGEMLLEMARNPQKWYGEYHLRSISETVNYVRKNRKGRLRKRLEGRKLMEEYLHGVGYNIRRLAQLRYLEGIRPTTGRYAA